MRKTKITEQNNLEKEIKEIKLRFQKTGDQKLLHLLKKTRN